MTSPTLVAAVTFFAMLSLGAIFTWHEHAHDARQRRELTHEIATHYARNIEYQINHTLTSLHYLALLIRPDRAEVRDFPQIAARQSFLYQGISELHLVSKDRAGTVRPALSYRNSDRVLRFPALDRLLDDPFQALQSPGLASEVLIDDNGDVAILGYLPAFTGNIESARLGDTAAGVVIALLMLHDVAESADLPHLTILGYDYEMLYIDDAGIRHHVASGGLPPQQPLLRQFSTNGQLWELRVIPAGGWVDWSTIAKYALFMIAISILSGMLANIVARLVRSRITLRAGEQRFRDLTELSSDWWWEQDENFRFVSVSSMQPHAGMSPADHIGKTQWELANTRLRRNESWDKHIEVLHNHQPFHGLIIERELKDGIRLLKVSGKPLFDADGHFSGYRGAATDITEEFNAQQSLRESEANFRGIFNVVPDPLIVRDEADLICQVNTAACRFLGAQRPEDLIGKCWIDMHVAADKFNVMQRARTLSQPHVPLPIAKFRYQRLDGRTIVGESTDLMLIKREGRRILTIIHDSSERAAAARRYEMFQHKLTRRVIATREHERRALSIELHDRVGQTLTAARFNLDFLREQLPQDVRSLVEENIASIYELLRTMSAHVRDLMAELHPPALDDHGLRTALAFHIDKLSQRSGIQAEIHGDFKAQLPQDKALTLFRIAQEALHNILKHAHCTKALVSLYNEGGRFGMIITDNGTGFDPAAANGSKFGLRIMRERAESIGAQLEIFPRKGVGTQIIVTWDPSDGHEPPINS